MSAFTVVAFLLAAFAAAGGACILILRARVLQFVRDRFLKILREDKVPESEREGRLPRMWIVVLIGIGWLVVAVIAALGGWSSHL